MSPLGHINERCGGSCYSKYTSFFIEKQAAFIELNRICHILRRNWTGERGKPGRCGLWTLSTLLLTCTWPPLGPCNRRVALALVYQRSTEEPPRAFHECISQVVQQTAWPHSFQEPPMGHSLQRRRERCHPLGWLMRAADTNLGF